MHLSPATRKIRRPPSADLVYAREMDMGATCVEVRKIRRRGGAAKLAALDSSARAILMQSPIYGNSRTISAGGLAARGMGQGAKRGPSYTPREVEQEIQRRLRERGLVKDA